MTTITRPTGLPDVRPADPTGQRIGDYIQVRSGIAFWPFDPRPGEIHISDIAYSLARVTRYTGHTRGLFGLSVAQHCVIVSAFVPPEDALAGLIHDAEEAYMGEISRPLKYMPEYAPIRAAGKRLQAAIYAKFGLGPDKPHSVHVADNRALAAEVRDLMTPDPRIWGKWLDEIEPLPGRVRAWPPFIAEWMFLRRFRQLKRGRFNNI